MKFKKQLFFCSIFLVVLFLSGCVLKTVDQLYSLPKRSEEYRNLQKAMDPAMAGLEFCSPLQGDNQQTVQLADLTGDGIQEAIVFAKGTDERPLKILVFKRSGENYEQLAAIETAGMAFEQVEYASLDDQDGLDLIVGRQLGNEVLHSLSVYSFNSGQSETLLTAGYTRFLVADLDRDNRKDLFVLRPGGDSVNGVAELYYFQDGTMEHLPEAPMSEPVESMKRVAFGGMSGEKQAVFVASRYSDDAIITDVFAVEDGKLINVSLSNDSGTSIKTVRNYYVYGDDIDNDGLIELPSPVDPDAENKQEMLRWYNILPDGSEFEKAFTYHNYSDRWFIKLQEQWMGNIIVERGNEVGNAQGFIFRLGERGNVLFTVYAFTGDDRESLASSDGRFPLDRTAEVVYACLPGQNADKYGLTQENLISSFCFIREAWKTGEM